MRLREEFITYNMDDGQVLVSTDQSLFNGMLKCNKSAALIVECLSQECTEQDILDKLLETYEVDQQTAAADLERVLGTLREIRAIEE